ncbi:MAG: hypothetical protein J5I93_28530 [Pirellulaceae bacterium]|nr:hypothetical protein [Pirellulaceae bacterium]
MVDTQVLNVPADHSLNKLSEPLKQRIVAAQQNLFEMEFKNAAELCSRALSDLKIAITTPPDLSEQPPEYLGDQSSKDLFTFFSDILTQNGVPEQAVSLHAANLLHRVQLLRAYDKPDEVIRVTCDKVVEVVGGFPQTADDIRCGRNPGDVLDPYILGAAQILMCAGDFEHTISATVAHKALMIIEGLLGHLHEDVIGAMRGNVRIPEPRGDDQETMDYLTNPFPGSDIIQPPLADRPLRFYQVKSKTGSAKGGDGRRLGLQLSALTKEYGGEAYYIALIGNTLRGHRSMAGVRRAAPAVVVLVGESAFRELTGSCVGPQLLLRLYQSAFEVASQQTKYSLESVVATIYLAFQERAEELGEGFLETVLHDAIYGTPDQQDSRHYVPRRRRQRGTSEE